MTSVYRELVCPLCVFRKRFALAKMFAVGFVEISRMFRGGWRERIPPPSFATCRREKNTSHDLPARFACSRGTSFSPPPQVPGPSKQWGVTRVGRRKAQTHEPLSNRGHFRPLSSAFDGRESPRASDGTGLTALCQRGREGGREGFRGWRSLR